MHDSPTLYTGARRGCVRLAGGVAPPRGAVVGRYAEDARPASIPRIRYLVGTMGKREHFIAYNRQQLPQLHLFRSTNGMNSSEARLENPRGGPPRRLPSRPLAPRPHSPPLCRAGPESRPPPWCHVARQVALFFAEHPQIRLQQRGPKQEGPSVACALPPCRASPPPGCPPRPGAQEAFAYHPLSPRCPGCVRL